MNSNCVKSRVNNSQKRYRIICERFDKLYNFSHEGIKLDFDAIVNKIAEEMGFSPRTIRRALRNTN
jgi:hypothetical protein